MHRLVVALVTLLGLAAGTFVAGYLLVFSASTDRAASLAPANTALYVNVYLQPSAGQQLNLSGLIGRLPGFADSASLDAKIDRIVENLLSGTGIDYATDLKPWLGDQVALAASPPETALGEPQFTLIATVKDPEAARASLDRLAQRHEQPFTTESHDGVDLRVSDALSYAFIGDVLVIAQASDGVKAVAEVHGGAASLAQQPAFRQAMDRLPPDHLASAFVDVQALVPVANESAAAPDGFSTAGLALVAEHDGLRVSGFLPYDLDAATESARDRYALGTEPSSLVNWMPPGTVAEAVVFGFPRTLEELEGIASGSDEGSEALGSLDALRALLAFGLGLDLDADVIPLLGREVAVAISGVENGLPRGQLLLRPDDPTAAAAMVAHIVERLGAVGATSRTETRSGTEITLTDLPDVGTFAHAVVDGVIVIGFSAEDVAAAIDAHASGNSLAGTDAYRRTFEVAGVRAGSEAFALIGPAGELIGLADLTAALPSDARDILAQLGSFGFTAPSRDDQIEFHAVVTVDDRTAQ